MVEFEKKWERVPFWSRIAKFTSLFDFAKFQKNFEALFFNVCPLRLCNEVCYYIIICKA